MRTFLAAIFILAAFSAKQLYAYSPYGDRTVLDAQGNVLTSASTDYGFTGRRFDAETGMWYFRARYFDSDMGRFISRDPLGYVDGYSLYTAYFAQKFAMDPSGKVLQYFVKVLNKCRKVWKPVSKETAIRARKNKLDVKVVGKGSSKEAKQIDRILNGKNTERHPGHELENGKTGLPHYQHKNGRGRGHTFYVEKAVVFLTPFEEVGAMVDWLDEKIFLPLEAELEESKKECECSENQE